MTTFDEDPHKFELFPDKRQIHSQLIEENKVNYLNFMTSVDALQRFPNIEGPTVESLEKDLANPRRK